MAVVNHINPILNPNVKDSRWLTLEVCREHQRNKCTRTENECKFAHPPAHVEVQNGRVIACFDSIKGKCQRKDPPCKYLHPPQHLREQLLQNGRNNLILRSMQMQAYHPQMIAPSIIPMAGAKAVAYPTTMVPGQIPYVAAAVPQSRPAHVNHPASYVTFASSSSATAPTPQYLTAVPTTAVAQFNPYGMPTMAALQSGAAADGTIVTSQFPGVITTPVPTKAPARPDRLELTHCLSDCGGEAGCEPDTSFLPASYQVCREFQRGTCSRQPSDCRYAHPTENVSVESGENQVTVCMDYVKNKCTRDSCRYFHPPPHLQSQIKAAQSRANSAAASSGPAQAVPQVVEVVPQSKKRLRDSAEELVLPSYVIPPYKRLAVEGGGLGGKGGLPTVYQPALPATAAAYQQATLMQLQQQPSYPLNYSSDMMSAAYTNYLPQVIPDPVVLSGTQPLPSPVGTVPVVGVVAPPPAAVATTTTTTPAVVGVSRKIPSNAYSVEYFDQNKQLLDTLPQCPDFRAGLCDHPSCTMVHVTEDVETTEEGRVIVCRDSARNACRRVLCKYYHIPVPLPPSI